MEGGEVKGFIGEIQCICGFQRTHSSDKKRSIKMRHEFRSTLHSPTHSHGLHEHSMSSPWEPMGDCKIQFLFKISSMTSCSTCVLMAAIEQGESCSASVLRYTFIVRKTFLISAITSFCSFLSSGLNNGTGLMVVCCKGNGLRRS
jgi:hypothetical protein